MNQENNNIEVKNNQDTIVRRNNSIFRPNKIVAIVIYVLVLFVIAGFITIGLAIVIALANEVSMNEVLKSLTAIDLSGFSEPVIRVNAIAQGWGNFIGYLLAFAGVVFFMRDDVVTDFKDLGKNKRFYASYIPIAAIVFVVATYIVDIIVSLGIGAEESANQALIEAIITKGGALPMILATVLLAPVVEELIYRKAIFSLCKKYGLLACYLFSILFFTLPHVITSDMSNIGTWLLQCIPYAVSGGLLCLVYHKSNYNIYAAIAAHMANNLLASIMILIYY